MGADMGLQGGADRLGVLGADEPAAHLGAGLGGQHGLEPVARIAAADPVDLEGGAVPHHLEPGPPRLAHRVAQADAREILAGVEAEVVPVGAQLVRQLLDALVEAGQRHPAVGVLDPGQRVDEDLDRVRRQPAEHPRVQVAVGGADDDLLAHQPAQLGGDGGAAVGIHPRVADQREVGGKLGGIGLEEGHEIWRAALLLALEKEREPGGQRAVGGFPRPAGLDEGHQLALVVRRAAAADHRAVGRVLDHRIEGVAGPEPDRVHRLHVVMAVEQQPPRPRAVRRGPRHHHRVARRLSHLGRKSQRRKLVPQPAGGAPHLGRIDRIGRDRGDAQERLEPVQRRRLSRVERRKHLVQACIVGHLHPFPEQFHRVPMTTFCRNRGKCGCS